MNSQKKRSGIILSALFAALIASGFFIQIPLPGGIPIIIQDMMALLSGLLLGPVYGTISTAAFLILGIIGLPVFSGKAGIHVITAGPTGGFLIGYVIASCFAGIFLSLFLPRRKKHSSAKSYLIIFIAVLLENAVMFTCGILGFMRATDASLAKAVSACLIPFLPGNSLKQILMIFITKKFRPVISEYIQ